MKGLTVYFHNKQSVLVKLIEKLIAHDVAFSAKPMKRGLYELKIKGAQREWIKETLKEVSKG
jgi:hypothetical protein